MPTWKFLLTIGGRREKGWVHGLVVLPYNYCQPLEKLGN